MKSGYTYRIESRQAPNLIEKSGASFQFIVVKNKMTFEPELIRNKPLWLIVECDQRIYLVQRGIIESVSVIEEGPNKDDYLIELYKSKTIKTISPNKDKRKWEIQYGKEIQTGFTYCDAETVENFEK